MTDLHDFKRRHVTGWGDRMTVGVQVKELRELVEELETLRERRRVQQAALEAAQMQRVYWERMARASYVEQSRLQLQINDLLSAAKGGEESEP